MPGARKKITDQGQKTKLLLLYFFKMNNFVHVFKKKCAHTFEKLNNIT